MKSDKKSIIWGLILLLVAAGLILLVFFPEVSPLANIALWKWPLAAVLVYWLLNNVIFGKSLRAHLDVFLPLGFLFILFKPEIAPLIGKSPDFVSGWAIFGIALLLTIALHLLMHGSGDSSERVVNIHYSDNADGENEKKGKDTTRNACNAGEQKNNTFSSSAVFCDLAERTSFSVNNLLGATEIYFQNTDAGDAATPIRLTFSNRFGEMVIHVPSDWKITSQVVNSFGDYRVRSNPETYTRELILQGSNRFGDTSVRP